MKHDYYEIVGHEVVGVSENELLERFHTEFSDYSDLVSVAGYQYQAGDVLRAVDYAAYREEFLNWLDGQEVFDRFVDAEEHRRGMTEFSVRL